MKKVEVTWVDANIMHDWALKQEVEQDGLPTVKSMGYLFMEDDDKIVIVMGWSNYGAYIERKAIPKGCIKSIKELRIK